MGADHPIMRNVYIVMAALAGSITSLAFMNWRQMDWPERGLTVFVGATFAIFAVPWIWFDVLGWRNASLNDLRYACGLAYAGGTCANAFIPLLIRLGRTWLSGKFSAPAPEEKQP